MSRDCAASLFVFSRIRFPSRYIPKTVRALAVAKEEWHCEMMRKLFDFNANGRRERRARNASYNGRSSFMEDKCLNVTTVRNLLGNLEKFGEEYRAKVARQLNVEAAWFG